MAVQILGDCWDTITGCTKISAGCRECYAEKFTRWINRLDKTDKYSAGFGVVACHDDELDVPRKRKKPKTYFVNSMADTFHKDVPDGFIKKIFEVMNSCPQHTFQLLTKRSDRMAQLSVDLKYTDNIWQGVSVERQDYVHRIDDLRKVPARIRFVMFEPLVGSVGKLNLDGIHWTIVGGESGGGINKFRPMDVQWVREIRDQCVSAGVKFVFKQFSGKRPEQLGRLLDGKIWDERP
jgi:protein gp37